MSKGSDAASDHYRIDVVPPPRWRRVLQLLGGLVRMLDFDATVSNLDEAVVVRLDDPAQQPMSYPAESTLDELRADLAAMRVAEFEAKWLPA